MPIYEYLCPYCKTITEKYTTDINLKKIICKCGKTSYKTISRSNFNTVELKFSRDGEVVE